MYTTITCVINRKNFTVFREATKPIHFYVQSVKYIYQLHNYLFENEKLIYFFFNIISKVSSITKTY